MAGQPVSKKTFWVVVVILFLLFGYLLYRDIRQGSWLRNDLAPFLEGARDPGDPPPPPKPPGPFG